jgi:cell division septation protein DedD
MDTAMRDLEHIQEQPYGREEAPTRRIGMLVLAGAATVTLVLSVGLLVGEAALTEAQPARDPLDALIAASPTGAHEVREARDQAPLSATVDREALTFPAVLDEGSPELAAVVAAAAAELAHPDPLHAREAAFGGDTIEIREMLPAAVAASPEGAEVRRALGSDAMMAAALPHAAPRPSASPAPMGSDGEHTLQVISYRTRAEADLFANALRQRGHRAFVTHAEIPGRGTYFRVRIGPFETQREAESYRQTFELEERMNTFVVRQVD